VISLALTRSRSEKLQQHHNVAVPDMRRDYGPRSGKASTGAVIVEYDPSLFVQFGRSLAKFALLDNKNQAAETGKANRS
jgi:hypothetical protein